MPTYSGELLSARVCLSHSVDPSIAEYFVDTSDLNDAFKLVMSLGSGSRIRVTKANLDFFLCLSRDFGNSDFYISLMEHFDDHFICSQMRDSTTLDLFSEYLIGRISSNFSELTWSEFDAIPVSVLFHILSRHLLKISSEDDLFSYISSHICSNPECSNFLQFIHFEYVSPKSICCFLSAVPDWIDRRLWESISHRLISPVRPVSHSKSHTEVKFPLTEAESIDGIISYITRKHGGNVHDKGIVTITSKSVFSNYAVRNAADLTSNSLFSSKNQPGLWVCWDFHEMRVCPTH
jgi:hypothetical protein